MAKEATTEIRVFYPCVEYPGVAECEQIISETHKVKEIIVHDPIYRELVFIDLSGVRYQVAGLPYIIRETPEEP